MSFLVRLPTELYQDDAFEGYAPGPFSIGSARAAMWLAQLAYEDEPDKLDTILTKWGLRRIRSFERPFLSLLPMASTGGFVARNEDTVFIAIAGTDPLLAANWVTNFRFAPNSSGIHQGFGAALDAVWNDITAAVGEARPTARAVVCGHSLGGALAVLCADRLTAERGITVEAVYTFGMPRVGTPAFAEGYNARLGERTYRLVHGHDIVPTVPPPRLGFQHVGRFLACETHQRFDGARLSADLPDSPPFVERWLDSTREGLRRLFFGGAAAFVSARPITQLLPPGIADHLPDRYWNALPAA